VEHHRSIACHWTIFVLIVILRAVIEFEFWIREHLLSHERISQGVGLLLMTFNEFAAEE